MNPTTDLHYSHAGDRILVGSMLDGVLRIWSWDVDPLMGSGIGKQCANDKNLRSIVIKLSNPLQSKASTTKNSRRRSRGGGSSNASILLDMACWTSDDSKIITSQSQPVNATKFEPDSNYIFVWDSRTGHCLLGIAGAHAKSTPVILPHPTNSSVFCSGGSEGYVKVWDCDTGRCLFSHRNELQLRYLADAAAPEQCGSLHDGAMFPDGTGFVMSDSCGNILMFDSIVPSSHRLAQGSSPSLPPPPNWMKEQYRANDYYDLKYEVNGYCVEQGSDQPPHLAPRGVRCMHNGSPFLDAITEAFRKLDGPQPLPVQECLWLRQLIRCSAEERWKKLGSAASSRSRRGNIMQEYDPLTTVLVRSTGEVIEARGQKDNNSDAAGTSATGQGAFDSFLSRQDSSERRQSSSGRLLSSNYRWRDYTDMLQEERMYDEESDDEEFQLPARSRSGRSASQIESDEESDNEMDLELESPQRGRTQRRPRARQVAETESVEQERPSRSSRRRRRNPIERYDEEESDDDAEFVSTNNDPSGPYVEDYNRHFFRLPPNGPDIQRQWLQRLHSDAGYAGTKTYAPQVRKNCTVSVPPYSTLLLFVNPSCFTTA